MPGKNTWSAEEKDLHSLGWEPRMRGVLTSTASEEESRVGTDKIAGTQLASPAGQSLILLQNKRSHLACS